MEIQCETAASKAPTDAEEMFKLVITPLVLMHNRTDRQKDTAAIALASFGRHSEHNCVEIDNCGGIHLLVKLLKGSADQKQYAAATLAEIAKQGFESRSQIGQTQVIPLLKELLLSGTNKLKKTAAEALANVALESANRIQMVNQGVVPALMKLLRGTEAQQQYAASALMHIAYNTRTDGTKLKAGSGLLNPLIRMLNGSDSQKTSARQLSAQLARHEDSNRVRIASKGIIPLVIKLLVGSDAPKAFAALALGKIMWANKANATKAAKCGAVYPLIVLLAGDNLQRACGACALAELMRASAPIQVVMVSSAFITFETKMR